MKAFEYIRVQSIDEACSVQADYGSDARVLAGGTDLMIEWRRSASKPPKVVVDISRISELSDITEFNEHIVIKPMTTHTELLQSKLLHQFAPLLSAAASTIGSPQIRNRGTIGGNIMNAAPCADTVPPLVALDATITLQSKRGKRELHLADLFLKPYTTVAELDELLVEIRFSKLSPSARSSFIKLGRRNAMSISRLSVAAVVQLGKDGRIADARIVPGAAFPTWQRVQPAEGILIGEKPSERLFAAAGKKVSEVMIECTGRRWSTEYKEPVIAVLVRRALEQCTDKSKFVSPVWNSRRRDGKQSSLRRSVGTQRVEARSTCAITTTINSRSYSLTVPANRTLLELLRDDLGLTATKCGCEIGECGACTVLIDGKAVNSCLVLTPQIDGREVTTVEGLKQNGKLHPLQESFMDYDAAHCGFCTPGMLMSAKALLDENAHPTQSEIRTAISGNLCRCTGYVQIVDAIKKAAE